MRNTLYSLVAVTVLSVALFSSAGTRPALAASDAHNQVAWGETAYSFEGVGAVVLSGSPDNVLVDTAIDAEAQAATDATADAAADSLHKTMKLRLSPAGGGKHGAVAM